MMMIIISVPPDTTNTSPFKYHIYYQLIPILIFQVNIPSIANLIFLIQWLSVEFFVTTIDCLYPIRSHCQDSVGMLGLHLAGIKSTLFIVLAQQEASLSFVSCQTEIIETLI